MLTPSFYPILNAEARSVNSEMMDWTFNANPGRRSARFFIELHFVMFRLKRPDAVDFKHS
jgi:hypothetical protein